MGRRVHVIKELDKEARTAVCANCGPVRAVLTSRGVWRCQIGKKGRGLNLAEKQQWRESMEQSKAARLRRWRRDQLEKQHGRCAICESMGPLHIDHDHACCATKWPIDSCGGCLRGLLCRRCNIALGYFQDDPASILNALRYIGSVSWGRSSCSRNPVAALVYDEGMKLDRDPVIGDVVRHFVHRDVCGRLVLIDEYGQGGIEGDDHRRFNLHNLYPVTDDELILAAR